MKLFRRYLKRCIKSSRENEMRVRIIGDVSAFDPDIQESIRVLEDYSKDYDKLHFQIALNYGSRDEILRAVNHLMADVRSGKRAEEKITEEMFSSYLDTAGVPDPDLMIRTSGEQRLSNFCGRWPIRNFTLRMFRGRIFTRRNWSRLLSNIIAETDDSEA